MRIITDDKLDTLTKDQNPRDYRGFYVPKGCNKPNKYIEPLYWNEALLYKVQTRDQKTIFYIYKRIDNELVA